MTISNCISDMISSLEGDFVTDQRAVIESILRAEKIVFLDTCFITRTLVVDTEKLLAALETIAGEKEKLVFVISELVLYELKDSEANVLQEKNKVFLDQMLEYGFTILILKEEAVCDNISSFMGYSKQKWNTVFSRLIHDNVANLSFGGLIRTDKRMPYYGFEEFGYSVPNDNNFINDIIIYLKNVKKSKDSMAEELICISLFFIFELTNGSKRNEYMFCTHDLHAIARLNKLIQTSYPNMQKCFKPIDILGIVQYMVKNEMIDSKEELLNILSNIMNENTRLIVWDKLPFAPIERTLTLEDAVNMIFEGEHIELAGQLK